MAEEANIFAPLLTGTAPAEDNIFAPLLAPPPKKQGGSFTEAVTGGQVPGFVDSLHPPDPATLGPDADRSVPFGSVGRGFNQLQQGLTMLGAEAGIISPATAAKAIAQDEADKARYPIPPSMKAAQQAMGAAEGWGEATLIALQNPAMLASVVGESVPASAAMLAAGVAGSVAGPGGTMAGVGAVSGSTEYASSILDQMRESKIDLKDATAIEKALQDPAFMSKAREKAVKRGLAVGAFDAISMGLAGRIAKAVGATAEGASTARRLAGGVAETGAQAAAGAGGEATAQVATEGEIKDKTSVILEALSEGVTGAPEVAIGMAQQAVPAPAPPDAAVDTGVLPPEEEVPGAGRPMVIDDPEFTAADGEVFPADPLHGQTVEVLQEGDGMSRVRLPDGSETMIGNSLLKPPEPVAPKDAAIAGAAPAQAAEALAVPDSPRLTPSDRKSPIPNELIDAGKSLVESATGKPSTFTTTTEIDGKTTVVTGNVSDLVAGNRAEAAALASQITAGVSTPEILAGSLPAAAESAVPSVAAPSGPGTAAAPVAPSIATPEAPAVELSPADLRGAPAPAPMLSAAPSPGPAITPEVATQLDKRYGPPGTQARTLEEARLIITEPYTAQTRDGDTIEVTQPNYETFEARVNGQKVGTLNMSPRGPYASSVTVEPGARRQGVASAMYAAAERALGRQMVPSPMGMSGDAIGFWKKRFADVEPEEKQAVLQEALRIGQAAKIGNSARARVDALGYVEPTDARIEGETDKVFAKRVVDKRPEPTELSENYTDYFIMTGAKVIPIGDLVSSKTDEENAQGGGNAAKRMAAAAKGELDKRAPITVQKMANGKYLIKDGNGTYTSVKALGWKAMPVLVESGIAAAPKAEAKAATADEAPMLALKEKIAAKREAAPAEPAKQKILKERLAAKREIEAAPFASDEQRAPFITPKPKTFDQIYAAAPANKKTFDAVIDTIGEEFADQGVKAKKANLKERETAEEKMGRKGYSTPAQITDIIRGGFLLNHPGQADVIIARLRQHFDVLDEGWARNAAGYVDRKALVLLDDGTIAEVQFWEPNILRAKEKGDDQQPVRGHALYEEERALPTDAPRAIELRQLMSELYGRALALADPVWSSTGKGSKPQPRYVARQSASDMMPAVYQTSWKSTSTQSPSGRGLSSALASKSPSSAGRKSQETNFTGTTPPSGTNVVQTQPVVKGDSEETPMFQARTLREGTETAESIGLPPTREVTTPKGKTLLKKIVYNTYRIASALQARQRTQYGTIARNDRSPEAIEKIADWMVDEVEFEMQPGREARSGVGWYSHKFQRALDAFGAIFPELTGGKVDLPGVKRLGNQKNARDFFTALIAITSDGAKVNDNFNNARRLYGEFRQTGTISTAGMTGGADRITSMRTNVSNILKLLADKGPEGMHTGLMQEDTVANLKKAAKLTDTVFSVKLQAHMRMPLSALVFGPKLGAFYANLMGAHGYLTMDRWWSRTFNRYRGQLLKNVSGLSSRPTDKQGNKIGLAKFKETIGQPNLSDDEALLEAYRHSKLYEDKGFKNGTAVEKAANTIRKDAEGTEDTPWGPVDRTFMIEAVERARAKLAQRGTTISLADIQAILWYYEKRLYSELGARGTADISYEEVARRIAAQGDQGDRPGRPAVQAAAGREDEASFSLNDSSERGGREGFVAATPEEFIKARNASSRPEFLSPLSPADIAGHKLLLSPDRTHGVAVDADGDVQNVFNNGGPKGSGAKAVVAAIENGGRTLDAYSGYLPDYYRQFGFVETGRMPFNREFAPDGWDYDKNGTPDVVFMAWQGYPDSAEAAINRANSTRTNWIVNDETANTVTDWDAAKRESRQAAADPGGAGVSQGHGQNKGPSADRAGREPEHRTGVAGGPPRLKTSESEQRARKAAAKAAASTKTETRKTSTGTIHFALSDAFKGKADAVFKDLRAALDKLGLGGIDLNVWQQIFADMDYGVYGVDGLYLRKVIDVSLQAKDAMSTLHHEALHALVALKLFTPTELTILKRYAKKHWITDQIKATYPEEVWVEEAIAHAFGEWSKGRKVDGVLARSFKKIQAFLKALYAVLTKHDIRTSDDIFEQIAEGKIGRRGRRSQNPVAIAALNPTPKNLEAMFLAAWHGTPHEVDRFTLTKIGTGEGVQAYGWGLYFAGKRQVAEYYRNTLARPRPTINGKAFDLVDPWLFTASITPPQGLKADDLYMAARVVFTSLNAHLRNGMTPTEALDAIDARSKSLGMLSSKPTSGLTNEGKARNAVVDKLRSATIEVANPGRLYQVNIPENEDLLDYDRPLKVQPEKIQQAVHKLIDKHFLADAKTDWADGLSGHHFYDDLSRSLGSDSAASAALREAGIPGHRYLDAGSRGGGEKTTHNYVIYDESAIAIEARFALQNPPHTTQQANAVTQGFLNRGQPIDRAIRTPFDLLGGLDNQNVWNPGKRLTEKMGSTGLQGAGMAGLIGGSIGGLAGGPVGAVAGFAAGATVGNFLVKANPSPTGLFRWYGPIAENAKRGLIDRYGLSEEYIEAERQADLAKGDILRQAQGILKVLSQAGVGSAESRVLKSILTGQPVNDPDMTRLAVPIRQAIDDLGAEAVSLGLISAESFDRNRGAYLHRVYAKNEANQNNLVRWVSNVMGNKRRKIIGDQLKGRGIFLDLTTERLMKDASNYPEPQKGETWRILDRMNAAGDKASKRVYWPANKPVPMEYQGSNWVDRGPWEVRQIGKGKTTLWRDYTEAERTKMGEIIDARYLIAKTFMLMANDLSTGRFYKEVAANAEWSQEAKPAERWMEAGEYSRYWNDPDIAWVKVPDTNIQDTGGKKRWGALAGKYVRAEIWRDLNEVEIASQPRWWRTLMTQWKLNKTARNPVVHMNNVMSNLMFMDLADVRLQDLVGGIKAYASSSAVYEEARDNGAFGSDMISQEMRDNVLQPILDEIAKQSTGTTNPLFAGGMMDKAKVLGIMADKIWTFAKGVDQKMLDAYQAEDEIFRMAAYMRRRSLGDSPKVAALNARDQFLNYDIRAPWVNAMRNTALPFISYTYRAVPKLMESIMHRPWKVAKYAALAYGVNALSYMLDDMDGGDDDGEERERAALRKEERGRTWLGVPRMVRMPWRDDHGLPVFLDVRRWIPAGDIFDTTQGSSAVPIPGPLQFGGPLQMAFELAFNKKAFDGEEITNELTDTAGEQAKNVADWAWKSWAPGAFWIPNSWYWTKISNALYGATDTAGRPYSIPQALLSSIGVKVRPLDVENGIMWNFKDFQKLQQELKSQMRAASRQLQRGLISQSAFDRQAASIMEKFGNLSTNVDAYDKTTRKPKRELVE